MNQQINKVAEISLIFWVMKIIATTLGETLGDNLSMTMNLGYSTGLFLTLGLFVIALATQLFSKRYIPSIYWFVIISTTTLGTEISDFMDRSLDLGYALGSTLLFFGLATTLYLWYKKFKDIEVYPIFQKNKEIYYFIAILFSNSLGTAFGDYLTDNLEFSYLGASLITALVILLVIALHYFTKINRVLLFWVAFIFTRPFGATFGDFLTKPLSKGGLDLGTLPASLVSISLMLILIIFVHLKINKESKLK